MEAERAEQLLWGHQGRLTKDKTFELDLEGFLSQVKKIGRVSQAEGVAYGEDRHVMCTDKQNMV